PDRDQFASPPGQLLRGQVHCLQAGGIRILEKRLAELRREGAAIGRGECLAHEWGRLLGRREQRELREGDRRRGGQRQCDENGANGATPGKVDTGFPSGVATKGQAGPVPSSRKAHPADLWRKPTRAAPTSLRS